MTLPPSRTSSAHAQHDVELIAAIVDVDPAMPPADRERGERQLTACADCSRLHADLLALRTAVASASVPARPRDLTLSEADAARLRPRGWRQALAFLGSARDGFSRPLALGLTTFGLVALLVTSIPAGLLGGAATGGATGADLSTVGAAIPEAQPSAAASAEAAPAAAPAPSGQARESEAPIASSPDDGSLFSGAGEPDANDAQAERMAAAGAAAGNEPVSGVGFGWSIWQILAVLSLVAGIVLLALRRVARQLA
jgi:anti-sigma factor RsiW